MLTYSGTVLWRKTAKVFDSIQKKMFEDSGQEEGRKKFENREIAQISRERFAKLPFISNM